jgi:hypothetical protein
VNDETGHYFQTKKGLRQGDPMSPILFNIIADTLAVLIERLKNLGYFDGLVPHLVEDGLSILQYADDTIILLEDDLEKAKDMKLVLCAFEKLSGLKINFHKSELFSFGETKERATEYVKLFCCKVLTDKTRIHLRSASVRTYTFSPRGFPRFLSIRGARGLLALNQVLI